MISTENVYTNIIDIGYSIGGKGFNHFDIPDIEELFEDEEISDADTAAASSHDDNDAAEKFAEKVIAEGLWLCREWQTHFLTTDPDIERALTFKKTIKNVLGQYEDIYKNTRQSKQMLITNFIPSKSNQLWLNIKQSGKCSQHLN